MIDARDLLDAFVTAAPATRDARLGTVDPAYASGRPRVTLDGTTALSPAGFPRNNNYTPVAGDRVLLLPVGSSFVVLCKVV